MQQIIAIDVGNAFSVSYDGQELQSVRSLVAQPPSKRNIRPSKGLIEFDGELYHPGLAALKYDVYRTMATQDKQTSSAIRDSLVLIINLISIPEVVLSETTKICIQVPDLFTSYQHELVKELNGVKIWTYDGVQYDTRLQVVQVYQEGYGSWVMAHRAGILPTKGNTLVVDLGGGTAITTLIDNADGEVMKTQTYKRKGVIALTELLRNDYDLILDNDNDVVTNEQIFAALEDGTYKIGQTGADITPYIERHAYSWWKSIWDTTVSTYSTQFGSKSINRVLITGGGAHVIAPFIENARSKSPAMRELFYISDRPLSDNVTGIYYAAN